VPNGRGSIVIKTARKGKDGEEAMDEDEDEEDDSKEEESEGGLQHYTGISISVSFTSSKKGVKSMLQLSGGQQSVVALSLIFAIQRCDPSPFYLFDEIDSNLDAVHRTSVARMIANHKGDAQFICTTFRPEMLSAADKYYGVSFINKASQVGEINRDEAKELILVAERETLAASKSDTPRKAITA
jgi:structural maintenance of chromosome 3 (chondroitin sulfate proteoglycan 6)